MIYLDRRTLAIASFLVGTAIIMAWGLIGWLVWVGLASLLALASFGNERPEGPRSGVRCEPGP